MKLSCQHGTVLAVETLNNQKRAIFIESSLFYKLV